MFEPLECFRSYVIRDLRTRSDVLRKRQLLTVRNNSNTMRTSSKGRQLEFRFWKYQSTNLCKQPSDAHKFTFATSSAM